MTLLKKARINKKYTQEYIAKSLNMQLRTYQYIEAGTHEPKIITGLKICKLLEISPYDV
jgi:DNA-binding XRE family transcriptional regulator